MIVEAIFALLRLAVEGLSALLPTWSPIDLSGFVTAITAKADSLFGLLRWADHYFPVTEALVLGVAGLSLYVAALAYKLALFVLRSVRVLG